MENAWYVRPVGVSVPLRRGENMWKSQWIRTIRRARKTVEEGPEGPVGMER